MVEPGNSKGWTFDTFETWVDSTSAERHRAVEAALAARKEEAAHHNGLIDAMKDQQSMFVTRGQLTATLVAALGAVGTLIGILAYVVK